MRQEHAIELKEFQLEYLEKSSQTTTSPISAKQLGASSTMRLKKKIKKKNFFS